MLQIYMITLINYYNLHFYVLLVLIDFKVILETQKNTHCVWQLLCIYNHLLNTKYNRISDSVDASSIVIVHEERN